MAGRAIRRRRRLLVAGVLVTALTVSACSGSAGRPTSNGTIMTVTAGASGAYVENFNPFVPSQAQPGIAGTVFETLSFFNMAERTPPTPQLATATEFSDGGKKLTITTRRGVTWHDGTPFSAADVAFTFDTIRKRPELNSNGLTISSVTATDDDTVVMTFPGPAYSELWRIAGRTLIAPEHVWAKIPDPAKELNPEPIGTGPFTLASFTPQTFLLRKNPRYWEKGKPAIDGMRFISFSDNTSANQSLLAEQIDWGSTFVPDPQKNWVSKDPATHLVPSTGIYQTSFVPNTTT